MPMKCFLKGKDVNISLWLLTGYTALQKTAKSIAFQRHILMNLKPDK